MFYLREVFPEDLDGLQAVAEHLDSVNLPHDREVLAELIGLSRRSFGGHLDPFKRVYVFGLFAREPGGDRLVGTSMIHAQHGTRRVPHAFFEVLTDERYSETLDKHFVHQMLRIGYNYQGPTEIGGLVLLPEYRGHEVGLGRWLSFVRFLYIALYRAAFRDEVLSELMPPLEPDGTSLLWESLGRHFTGMSYQEADRISQSNKEFIRTLFPQEPVYVCLLPAAVQRLVGQVGPETKGVEKMLRRIGFRYANRIDPFDGGPHFVARTEDISLVKASRRYRATAGRGPFSAYGLVCREQPHPPHFKATGTRFRTEGESVVVSEEVLALIGASSGDEVGVQVF